MVEEALTQTLPRPGPTKGRSSSARVGDGRRGRGGGEKVSRPCVILRLVKQT